MTKNQEILEIVILSDDTEMDTVKQTRNKKQVVQIEITKLASYQMPTNVICNHL